MVRGDDALALPRRADQDRLDAVVCVLIGLIWTKQARNESILISDVASGYMVSPASSVIRQRLEAASPPACHAPLK